MFFILIKFKVFFKKRLKNFELFINVILNKVKYISNINKKIFKIKLLFFSNICNLFLLNLILIRLKNVFLFNTFEINLNF